MFRRRRSESTEIPAPPAAEPHESPPGEGGGGTLRYRMVQRLASIGDDFFIQDDQGERIFKVDGKTLRARDTLIFSDMDGNELCKIQQRLMRVRDTMEVEGPNGETLAHVHKAMITPLRDRYVIRIENGPSLNVHGNIMDHEFHISDDRNPVAQVSKKWFRVRDSYGVDINAGQNDIVILAATVCIDQMSNPTR